MTFLGCIPDLPLNLSCRRFQKSSSHFTKKTEIKNLGFFGDCAPKKWPFGQIGPRAVSEKARSAISCQPSAIYPRINIGTYILIKRNQVGLDQYRKALHVGED